MSQPDVTTSERLASVEAKLEFIQDLLREIKGDLKNQPTKDDYLDLKNRVTEMEESYNNIKTKVGIISGFFGLVTGLAVQLILKLLR